MAAVNFGCVLSKSLCVCKVAVLVLPSCAALSEALNMAIGLQAGEEDVKEPQSKEEQ